MTRVAVLKVSNSSYARFMSDANKLAVTLSNINDEAVYTNSVIECTLNDVPPLCRNYKNQIWRTMLLSKVTSWSWPAVKVNKVIINGAIRNDNVIRFFANIDCPITSIEITDGAHNTWIDSNRNGDFFVSN